MKRVIQKMQQLIDKLPVGKRRKQLRKDLLKLKMGDGKDIRI